MQGEIGSPILAWQARKLVFNNPTPMFVNDDTNTKNTRVTFVLILMNSRLGTKTMVSYPLLYIYLQRGQRLGYCYLLFGVYELHDIPPSYSFGKVLEVFIYLFSFITKWFSHGFKKSPINDDIWMGIP